MSLWSQLFPPAPSLTENNLDDQSGKVCIVTGGGTGIGAELVKILYGANARVYIATRTKDKAENTIASAKKEFPKSTGYLEYLFLDLADLPTVKACADEFLSKETRLDVLVNNAGVGQAPQGMKSTQGYEIQMAINCLGAFVFTELLRESMEHTVQMNSIRKGSVRVCWLGSGLVEMQAPEGGIDIPNITSGKFEGHTSSFYAQSKAGNMFLSSEFARRYGSSGVLSLCLNPGNLNSELPRYLPLWQKWLIRPLLYPCRMGAYTELYTGFSTDITPEHNGANIIPWGRLHAPQRQDIIDAMKPKSEGGSGIASDFWNWCEQTMREHIKM